MDPIRLKPGDVFVTKGDTFISKSICGVTRFWSTDNEAKYNHSGFIMDPDGTTFEALWKIGRARLQDRAGAPVLIARHRDMTPEKYQYGWNSVKDLEGAVYPVLRIPLHFFHLAKYVHWKFTVCSENVAKFLNGAGLWRYYWGVTPDDLADVWEISKYYDVIFQGDLDLADYDFTKGGVLK